MPTYHLTAVDRDGNAVCAGMDETLTSDSTPEQIAADWRDHWSGDERVAAGEITVEVIRE